MKQATKCTQKQLAYLAYWRNRGYQFGRDDVIPENTLTPPSDFAVRHPILDAAIGGMILALGFGGLLAYWIKVGAVI